MTTTTTQSTATDQNTTVSAAADTTINRLRCDQCGHRAYVVTRHGPASLELSWCGHHHRRNVAAGTVTSDQVIIDALERLTVREKDVHA